MQTQERDVRVVVEVQTRGMRTGSPDGDFGHLSSLLYLKMLRSREKRLRG